MCYFGGLAVALPPIAVVPNIIRIRNLQRPWASVSGRFSCRESVAAGFSSGTG